MSFKVGIVQQRAVPGKIEINIEKTFSKMLILKSLGVELIVLPALWATGFVYNRYHLLANKAPDIRKKIEQFSREHSMVIVHSLWLKDSIGYFQGSWIIEKTGDTLCQYKKVNLNTVLKEDMFLLPGNEACCLETSLTKVAAISDFDIYYPSYLRDICSKYIKVLLFSSSWPADLMEQFDIMLRARAIENQVFIVAANLLGEYEDFKFSGQSMIVEPSGAIVAKASDRDDFIYADIDIDLVYAARRKIKISPTPFTVIDLKYGA